MDKQIKINTLLEFLQMPIQSSNAILDKFATLDGAIYTSNPLNPQERFVYIKGELPIVLVAHSDTVADGNIYNNPMQSHEVIYDTEFNMVHTGGKNILGADDRAGCAAIWILYHSMIVKPSLLIVDGEECGCIGSNFLMQECPEIADSLNSNHFMIEIDRRGASDFKCYNVGTDSFRNYVAQQTGYTEPERSSFTDITVLCRDICGVNLSCGYYSEHSVDEYLIVDEWLHTIDVVTKWLLPDNISRFELVKDYDSLAISEIYNRYHNDFDINDSYDDDIYQQGYWDGYRQAIEDYKKEQGYQDLFNDADTFLR